MVRTSPFLSVLGHTVRGMNLNMGGITIDCAEPRSLAEFWTRALDLEVVLDAEGYFIQLGSPANPSQPYLGLQKVAEDKVGKNRIHLDLSTRDMDVEVSRLVALGAVVSEKHEAPGITWTVLSDPAGNEFCVGTHGASD
jgi:predicted enzyme related to lactoylglutathione lyase